MQWDDSHAAGFTTGTPWLAPPESYHEINAAAQMEDETSIRTFYQKLVRLRKEMDVISEGKIRFLYREDPQILAYHRYTQQEQMLVLCNLTADTAELTLPEGWETGKVLLSNWDRRCAESRMTLRPYECLALTK